MGERPVCGLQGGQPEVGELELGSDAMYSVLRRASSFFPVVSIIYSPFSSPSASHADVADVPFSQS
jgi:hypothetical protein